MKRGSLLLAWAITLSSCSSSPTPAAEAPLDLQPCAIQSFFGALERELPGQCGTLLVPEDRTRKNGRTIGVRVAVLRAEKNGAGAIFLLAGGPGQASRAMVAAAETW